MRSLNNIVRLSLLLAGLATAPAAFANWEWCCTDRQHAGATEKERCETNKTVVANRDECEALKKKHDAGTAHNSTCTPK